jgi:hypothetical protein
MDETSLRVKGEWQYLYHTVDRHGQMIDFLTAQRDKRAAKRFLTKAIARPAAVSPGHPCGATLPHPAARVQAALIRVPPCGALWWLTEQQ